jgi:hypothetical protein
VKTATSTTDVRRAPTSVTAFLAPRPCLAPPPACKSPQVWYAVPGTNPEHVAWSELTEDELRDRPARAPRRTWLRP